MVKNLPVSAGDVRDEVPSLVWEDPLKKEMASSHCSVLAWKIPWTEDPGGHSFSGLGKGGRRFQKPA